MTTATWHWITLLVAFSGLIGAAIGVWVALRASSRVAEPLELRRQCLEFDELLAQHQQRMNAWTARVAKRLQEHEMQYEPPPEVEAEDEPSGNGGDPKAELWARARRMLAQR